MDLIKKVSRDADWTELKEAFDKSAYPVGVRATDLKAWLKLVKDLAKEQNRRITRKFIKDVMYGQNGQEDYGVFSNDPAWDLITHNLQNGSDDQDATLQDVAKAEIQTVDALWKDYLKSFSQEALHKYNKAVENEEKLAGVPNLTNRQLVSIGKGFKREEADHENVYSDVRGKLYDYLEQRYGVHLDSLSEKDFQKIKEMVEYIVDNVYQTWASEEMEEIIKDFDGGDIVDIKDDTDIEDTSIDDPEFADQGDSEDADVSINFMADQNDEDQDGLQGDFNMDELDQNFEEFKEPITGLVSAFSSLKEVLDDCNVPLSVQKELVKQLVKDELSQTWDINVE